MPFQNLPRSSLFCCLTLLLSACAQPPAATPDPQSSAPVATASATATATGTANVAQPPDSSVVVDLGGLSVRFPSAPTSSNDTVPSKGGDISLATFELQIGAASFSATRVDDPNAKSPNARSVVDIDLEGALIQLRRDGATAHPTSERSVTVGEFQGRDLSVEATSKDQKHWYARILSVSHLNRNYILLATSPLPSDPRIETMFTSLAVTTH